MAKGAADLDKIAGFAILFALLAGAALLLSFFSLNSTGLSYL